MSYIKSYIIACLFVLCTTLSVSADELKRNIVLVSLDTLRVDYVSQEYMPFLSGLAENNVYFSNAYTSAPYTGPAHSSLFTGQTTTKNGVRHNLQPTPPKLKVLAELLQEQGYKTFGFASSILLSRKAGFHSGFDYYDSNYDKDVWVTCDEQVEKVRRYLTNLANPRPFFLFIHFSDMHQYSEKENVQNQLSAIPDTISRVEESKRIYIKEYGKTAKTLDDSLSKLFSMFSTMGLDSNTVYIVVSDHGEGLGDHGLLGHVDNLHEELTRMVLIIKNPNGLKMKSNDLVSIIDVTQTIVKIADNKRFLGDGVDLFSSIPSREVTMDTWTPDAVTEQHAIVDGSKKIIMYPKYKEIYDLVKDPHELKPHIEALKDSDKKIYPSEDNSISPENKEILKSLGYIQ